MRYSAAFLAAVAALPAVLAQQAATCGPDKKCPSESPCCGLYNQCGVGAFCLGGCNPAFSHSIDACVPAPACKSGDFKFETLDDIVPISKYLGDTSNANWVSEGEPVEYNGDVLLTLAPDTPGTVLSSTHYLWYGRVSATIATSQGNGVVSAFILMSNSRDEIDYEFVGDNVEEAQTNYYFQGFTDYTKGERLPVTDTRKNFHTYTIDWTPDKVEWIIDDQVRRTLLKKDTWDVENNRFNFPQTPSRIMISLWPAGLPTNGEGTIEWGGGLVEWDSPYMQNGYYYAIVKEVNVKCYDPPAKATIKGSKSYVYTNARALEEDVTITDKQVILKSLFASGEDPNHDPYAKPSSTNSGETTKTSATPSSTPNTVPGISGPGTHPGRDEDGDDKSKDDDKDKDKDSGNGNGNGNGKGNSGNSNGNGSNSNSGNGNSKDDSGNGADDNDNSGFSQGEDDTSDPKPEEGSSFTVTPSHGLWSIAAGISLFYLF